MTLTLTRRGFLDIVDHSLLKPELTYTQIKDGLEFAAESQCKAVCISPSRLHFATDVLTGTPVIIGTVIGFPSGCHETATKVAEAKLAYERGARELDMVINISAMVSGDEATVADDIRQVVEATPGHIKVIVETAFLTDEQIVRAARIASDAGAAFVKTSTGFAPSGATPHNIALLRKGAPASVQVKAAGGISTLADVLAVVEAGADRVGISRTQSILDEIGE